VPLPVISDTMRVAIEGTASNGHKWANVLHYRKSGALSYAGAIAILDPILLDHVSTNNGGGSGWNALAHTTARIDQFRYTPLDGASASTIITHAVAGVSGGDPLPASLALVVSLRTGSRGPGARGRVYTGPHIESDNDSTGSPSSALVSTLALQWTAHLAALVGTGVSLVVVSAWQVVGGVLVPRSPAVARDVTSVSVDSRWDTQRRRIRP